MFKRNDSKMRALLVLMSIVSLPALASEIKQYRPPHSEICFEFSEFKIECGDIPNIKHNAVKKISHGIRWG